jgi:hypothetical protein
MFSELATLRTELSVVNKLDDLANVMRPDDEASILFAAAMK